MSEPILDDDFLSIDTADIRRNQKISGFIRLLVSFIVTLVFSTVIVWVFDVFGRPTSGVVFKLLFGFACIVTAQLFIFFQIIRALQEIIHPKIFDRVPAWEKDYFGGMRIFVLWLLIAVGGGHLAYSIYPFHQNINIILPFTGIAFMFWQYRIRLKMK